MFRVRSNLFPPLDIRQQELSKSPKTLVRFPVFLLSVLRDLPLLHALEPSGLFHHCLHSCFCESSKAQMSPIILHLLDINFHNFYTFPSQFLKPFYCTLGI